MNLESSNLWIIFSVLLLFILIVQRTECLSDAIGVIRPTVTNPLTTHSNKVGKPIVVQDRRKRDTSIIFPDQQYISPPAFEPECANGTSFCETSPTYPKEYIQWVLREHEDRYNELFGEEHLIRDITQRVDNEKLELCGSVEEIFFPQAAASKDNKLYWVINDVKYKQGIRIEKCGSHTNECTDGYSNRNGYIATCEQKYLYRQLLAMDKTGKITKEDFKLPGCCQCVITYKP